MNQPDHDLIARLEALPPEAWDGGPEPPPLALNLEPSPRRGVTLRPLAAIACAVVLLALGTGLGALLWAGSGERGAQLTLAPIGARDPAAHGTVKLADDHVTLHVSDLKPTGRGEFYELWLLGEDKQLVALGSFRVNADGTATMQLPLPVNPGRYRYFDISLQPDNGDPQHSGLSVLRGPTRS
jgi:hypothetical protein